MNQILVYKLDSTDFNTNILAPSASSKKQSKSAKLYYSILIVCILVISSSTLYSCIYFYNLKSTNDYSKQLSQSFSVSTLYSSNNNYSTSFLNSNTSEGTSTPFIIGAIEIPKINLYYPILSYATEESLKKSLARFAGPMPNETGNLCIAGHNNIDNSFFGKLGLLEIGDEIKIYDLSGNYLIYYTYDKYETTSSDTSCTSQETNGLKIITLITCNSLKDTRKIYKAKAE